jgi:hypothetical protein
MIKRTYFDTYDGEGWPDVEWLESYFLTEAGRQKFFADGNDSWGLKAYGLGGSESQSPLNGRVDVDLTILGHPELGILLCYDQSTASGRRTYFSKGNMARLNESVETFHGDRVPAGLFLPFQLAWSAIKQFIETEGDLPRCIAWLSADDLPADAFQRS